MIDCDVHNDWANANVLLPYIDDNFRDYLERGERVGGPESFPHGHRPWLHPEGYRRADLAPQEGMAAGADYAMMKRELLDKFDVEFAILTGEELMDLSTLANPYYASALARAGKKPVVHVIGAHQLMRRGIMMRDGTAFERLAEADRVAFDKTGTLTLGQPTVIGAPEVDRRTSRLAKTLASHSSHPAAKAVADHFASLSKLPVSDIKEVPGFGVEASYQGKLVRLGRARWVQEIASGNQQPASLSGVSFAIQAAASCSFELEDGLRPGAAETIEEIQRDGLDVEILSGDQPRAVAAIARSRVHS